MEFTLKPKNRDAITFWCSDNGGYIYTDLLNGREGTLGTQLCAGGRLYQGATVMCEAPDLARVARSWWKQYRIKNQIGATE